MTYIDHPIFRTQEELDLDNARRELRRRFIEPKPANDWTAETASQPDPADLYGPFWTEGETSCLFADSNTGKSILAVQIGEEIARQGNVVVYFDFELSSKQFQKRYTNLATGEIHQFPDSFYRAPYFPERAEFNGFDPAPRIMEKIEEIVKKLNCRHLIIDNINALTTHGQSGEGALKLMAWLRKLKGKYGLSILMVAHTPKRNLSSAVTDNDLAGSKNLFNLFDSAFAMAKVPGEQQLRYLKQLKVRSAPFAHPTENVQVLRLEKAPDGFLGLTPTECLPEEQLFPSRSDRDLSARSDQASEAAALRAQGLTHQQIADRLGISPTTVARRLR